jgi:Mrp family chromosome partitioning ATPase
VLSGKGGVGKSLVAGLLAVALARKGFKIGVLDADVTGPSIPRMFGVARVGGSEGELIQPAHTDELGIRIMSLNLLMENEDDPVVWRGPLVSKAVEQFITDVDWNGIEYLVIDLPPGTSDVPLTVMQRVPLHGLLVVSSPQELVGMIVRKAINMAALLKVPVLGLVENMAYLRCPECGSRIALFGPSRADGAADDAGVPLLASIPVDPNLSALCDNGKIESYRDNPFDELVERITESLAAREKTDA